MSNRLRHIIEDYSRPEPILFNGRDEALAELKQKCVELGVKHLAYGIVAPGKSKQTLPFDAIATYGPDWIKRYFLQRYFVIDPVISLVQRERTPYDWHSLPPTKQTSDFFAESREFGVGQNGVAIPLRGDDGELCCLSFTADLTNKDWWQFKKEVLPHVFLFAHEFHAQALNARKPILEDVQLSSRELEVLKWAAEGKSMQDTAQILGVSDHTVRTYLQNCQRKLRGANKLHTVVQALRIGVIR